MKKLMIISTLATTCYAFGAGQVDSGFISGTSFESLTVDSTLDVSTNDAGLSEGDLSKYWSTAEGAETGTIKAYADGAAPNNRPAEYASSENAKYLDLDTGDILYRNVKANGAGGVPMEGIYIDTLVQFTAGDTEPDPAFGDKLVVYLKETEVEGSDPVTNLCIKAGQIDGSTCVAKTYTTSAQVVEKEWYRLTVKAVVDARSGKYFFVVYIDGNPVSYTDDVTAVANVGDLGKIATQYNTEKQLFPSLDQTTGSSDTISSIGFKGTGAVDDIAFTTSAPSFVNDPSEEITEEESYAKIVLDGDTTIYFLTIEDAIAAAAKNGGTVALTKDVVAKAAICITSEVVIDLAGKTIRLDEEASADAPIQVMNNGVLTIIDSATGGAVLALDEFAVSVEGTGSLTVEAGRYEGWVRAFDDEEDATVLIKGGSFSSEDEETFYLADCVAQGLAASYADGYWTVGEKVVRTPFQILIADLADEENATVALTGNIDLRNEEQKYISVTRAVTIDLNGQTLTANGTTIRNTGVALTIKDSVGGGKVVSVGGAAVDFGINNTKQIVNGGSITIESGIFESCEGAVIFGLSKNASITINGGTFSASDSAVVAGNGTSGCVGNTLAITGGTFNGGITSSGYIACGIYWPCSGTVSVTGGTFNITGGCGIAARAGSVTVDGATFVCTGTAEGGVGDKSVALPSAVFVFDSTQPDYPGRTEADGIKVVSGTFSSDVATVAAPGLRNDVLVADALVATATTLEGFAFVDSDVEGFKKVGEYVEPVDEDFDVGGKNEGDLAVTIPAATANAAYEAATGSAGSHDDVAAWLNTTPNGSANGLTNWELIAADLQAADDIKLTITMNGIEPVVKVTINGVDAKDMVRSFVEFKLYGEATLENPTWNTPALQDGTHKFFKMKAVAK